MDCVKLTRELNKLVSGWEYHINSPSSDFEFVSAFKDEMSYMLFEDKNGMVDVRGIYPKNFLEKPPQTQIKSDKTEAEIALHIVGVFLPKYMGKFVQLAGRSADAIAGRYSLAKKLEVASGGFVTIREMGVDFPELGAYTGTMNVEGSVRSGDLVYLDLVVPASIAEEIMKLLAMLKGGSA